MFLNVIQMHPLTDLDASVMMAIMGMAFNAKAAMQAVPNAMGPIPINACLVLIALTPWKMVSVRKMGVHVPLGFILKEPYVSHALISALLVRICSVV